MVDGTISLEYDESIQSNIPILHVDHLEGAKPLENEYVTFDKELLALFLFYL